LRLFVTRRQLLRARDVYLDAPFAASQAQAGPVAAVGGLTLAFGPCPPAPEAGPPM
jgi:hypothetical protein